MEVHNEKIQMKTLSACMNKLQTDGYNANFMVKDGNLKANDSDAVYRPEQVKIVNFYRFEGDSSPEDSSILYAIETANGERGTLADAYGPYSDIHVTNFIKQVEDMEKKVDKEKNL